jgi:hypothetical protein
MSDEEDDPVIDEIDIFNSSGLGDNAFLLQFPLISRKITPDVQLATRADDGSYNLLLASGTYQHVIHANRVTITQPLSIGVLRGNQLHLTPIHHVYQGRPVARPENAKNPHEMSGTPVDWLEMAGADPFIAVSNDDISAPMSVTLFQSRLADVKSDLSADILDGATEEAIRSRSPREQLYFKLLKDKTIHYHESLQTLKLQAHVNELQPVLLQYAYFVQGRWTVKPDEIPESELPRDLRLARAFFIVIFAHERRLARQELSTVLKTLELQKSQLRSILDGLGVNISETGEIAFKWRANREFEKDFKDTAAKGRAEILKLKEAVCMSRHDPALFDPYLS